MQSATLIQTCCIRENWRSIREGHWGSTVHLPLAAFTLNRSLLKASSVSKSHFTSSYNACRGTSDKTGLHYVKSREHNLKSIMLALFNIFLIENKPMKGINMVFVRLSTLFMTSPVALRQKTTASNSRCKSFYRVPTSFIKWKSSTFQAFSRCIFCF